MDKADREHASYVRQKVKELRDAVANAQSVGLSVEVPELVHLYITHGTASGSPTDWKISRNH
jgi:hypothetical protein